MDWYAHSRPSVGPLLLVHLVVLLLMHLVLMHLVVVVLMPLLLMHLGLLMHLLLMHSKPAPLVLMPVPPP